MHPPRRGNKLVVQAKGDDEAVDYEALWSLVKDMRGGWPGGKQRLSGPGTRHLHVGPFGRHGDRVVVYAGDPEQIWFYGRSGKLGQPGAVQRMRRVSKAMIEAMGDMLPEALETNGAMTLGD